MNVRERLLEYDGKRVAPFRQVVEHLGVSRESFEVLLGLAAEEEEAFEIGATWGLKAMAEAGLQPSEDHARTLVQLLATAQAPDAILHLLQLLPYLPSVPDLEAGLYQTLLTHLRSKRTFVRAWAYSGLGQLAQRNSEYRDVVGALFDKAMATESASVRARIRKVWEGF